MAFQGGGDGKRVARGAVIGRVALIYADHLAHAAQSQAGFVALGRQRDEVFDRIPFLEAPVGGEKHSAGTQIAGFPNLGHTLTAGLD